MALLLTSGCPLLVRRYIENEDFTPKKIESASKACTAMCQWVHAMNKVRRRAVPRGRDGGAELTGAT